MEVQVFGVRKSADTRKALRFFSERRIRTHFVDLRERAPSATELRRFAQRFGVAALVDRSGRRFQELGFVHAVHSDDWWLERLTLEPLLLHMPLVRCGTRTTMGVAEDEWKVWIRQQQGAPPPQGR